MSNNGSKWCWPATRRAIYARDGNRCFYCCSRERLTLDHIVPLREGGTHHRTNLVTACLRCNSRKQDKPLPWPLACVALRQAHRPVRTKT